MPACHWKMKREVSIRILRKHIWMRWQAFEKYESTTKAVAANREAHRYALEKYMAGKSAVYEYNEIKNEISRCVVPTITD